MSWPLKRKILFRPDRMEYIKDQRKKQYKDSKIKDCVFCMAKAKGVYVQSLVLFKDKYSMVILNKYPYNSGHVLVLPCKHKGDFLKITDNENQFIQKSLKRSVNALQKAYNQPAGFNLGLNLGAAAGAGIPQHLHYHVIPRWRGDSNFFPIIGQTKCLVETLEQTYNRLVPYF
jgi:ATP adenylyltransferase